MRAIIYACMTAASLALLPRAGAQTATTPPVGFSGVLKNPQGLPVSDGQHTVRFSLWNAIDDTLQSVVDELVPVHLNGIKGRKNNDLAHRPVFVGSESIRRADTNQALVRGTDYAIDYNDGIFFLLVTLPENVDLLASYQYIPTRLWQEQQLLTTSGGAFNASLGSVTPVPEMERQQALYLQIEVEKDGAFETLSPRTRLGSSSRASSIHKATGGEITGDLSASGSVSGVGTLRLVDGHPAGRPGLTGVGAMNGSTEAPGIRAIGANGGAGTALEAIGPLTLIGPGSSPSRWTLRTDPDGIIGWLIGGLTGTPTTVMTMSSEGNVGIGTDKPRARLEVRGSENHPATLRLSANAPGDAVSLHGDADGNGVVDAADYVVWRRTTDSALNVQSPGGLRLLNPVASTPTRLLFGPTDDCSIGIDPQNPGIQFRDPFGFDFIGGNVGIGTTTPSHTLSLMGGQGSDALLGIMAGANQTGRVGLDLLAKNGNSWSFHTNTDDGGRLVVGPGPGGGSHLTIERSTGNVGIGTSTPAVRLDVAGTTRMTGLQLTTGAEPWNVLTSDASGNASWQPPPTATGTAGGDLAGSYPNPTITPGAINAAKLANDPNSLAKVSGGAAAVSGGVLNQVNVQITSIAGPNTPATVGRRYNDNGIVAWGRVAANGTLVEEFGVASISKPQTGIYAITLDASATAPTALIPTVTPAVATAPSTAQALRIASARTSAVNQVEVYVNNGLGAMVDGAFTFIITAR